MLIIKWCENCEDLLCSGIQSQQNNLDGMLQKNIYIYKDQFNNHVGVFQILTDTSTMLKKEKRKTMVRN